MRLKDLESHSVSSAYIVRHFMRGYLPAFGQAVISDDVRTGHHLASMLCDECHIAARDQAYPPTRDPPASSFESIAQRKDVTTDSLEHFLKTTHEGLDNPKGMENPGLADFQVKALVAYILSLRK